MNKYIYRHGTSQTTTRGRTHIQSSNTLFWCILIWAQALTPLDNIETKYDLRVL